MEDITDFRKYQEWARTTSVLTTDRGRVDYGLLNMAGEVGEITSKHAKAVRDGTELDVKDLTKEVGDLMWSIACYCDGMGIEFDDVFYGNMHKLNSRKARNKIAGSGDNR